MAFVRFVCGGGAVRSQQAQWIEMRKGRKGWQVDFREGDLLRIVGDVSDGHLLDHLLLNFHSLDDGNMLDYFVGLSNFNSFENWDLLDNFNLERTVCH